MNEIVKNAVELIKPKIMQVPSVAVILGSGLGELANNLTDKVEFFYKDLGMCESTVKGHLGKMIFGFLKNKYVCFLQGRVHLYEGYSAKQVVLPIYVLKELGIENLIITNSAGGVNPQFKSGDLMLIDDVINLTAQNPLAGGAIIDYGETFIDMKNCFVLNKFITNVENGVYVQLLGPTYETKAEINMLKTIGADAVGMSTVMEVIAGKQCQMKMAGISLITNSTGNMHPEKLNHSEVIEVAEKSKEKFKKLIVELIEAIWIF